MNLTKAMDTYFEKIKSVTSAPDKAKDIIAGECVFFDKDDVLDFGKKFGNSRHPYSRDGLTLWAHSSGDIIIEESTLHVFQNTTEGREPKLAFFAGEAYDGEFFPISLTGVAKQLFERGVNRYTVFTPYATYYLTETATMRAAVRVFLDKEKRMRFNVCIKNTSEKAVQTYVCSYFNFFMKTTESEAEAKWYKKTAVTDSGFNVSVTEHFSRNVCFERYATVSRDALDCKLESTTSHCDFCGGYNNQLTNAESLRYGTFGARKPSTTFNETSIAADMARVTVGAGECFEIGYTIAIGDDPCEVFERANSASRICDADIALKEMLNSKTEFYKQIPDVSFSGFEGIKDETLGYFINKVFKQTEFCARAKNYAGPYIGIRDIFQQLEASLMWIPEYSRTKIIEALNYIGEDGRPPRQYSYKQKSDVPPDMDLRPFIDQGNWIISTVYEYLCFTGDLSILDEVCDYYKLGKDTVSFSERRDSVLEHLITIVNYLVDHIDSNTDCLRAMYGDWNDALDGLGRTEKHGEEYGNGVSVMATLHLYRNLYEIKEIIKKCGKRTELIEIYTDVEQRIAKGVMKYAIDSDGSGNRKVLHGWGDDISYKIGSFSDNDGECRDSLTSNAQFILSGAINLDRSLKKDILAAYSRLDSKYGFKTFEPYFAKTNRDVGRIVKLPKGTAENGATYIHATLFAIWSLFRIGECRTAWEQIYKILPITHEFVSTSPFVMPNSYIHNEEEYLDGESMGDWFTGSGCVLIKVLVRSVFGIEPNLDVIQIAPANYIPTGACSIKAKVRGVNITANYKNEGNGKRTFTVNGELVSSTYDDALKTEKILLSADRDYVIEVTD